MIYKSFSKGTHPLIPFSYRLNSITVVLYNDTFGIKLPTKVDMSLNKTKGTKLSQVK